MLGDPKVFDWEKYRDLSDAEDLRFVLLALRQWLNGNDMDDEDDLSMFEVGFKAGWLSCKAVGKLV